MGRILDLCSEIAAAAEEGPEGLILSPEDWGRLRGDWEDDDIEDALGLVRESLLQGELVDAADSLSARLVEVLGALGEELAFRGAEEQGARIPLAVVSHIARRVHRVEDILEVFREGSGPDRRGFDTLRRRLADLGLEDGGPGNGNVEEEEGEEREE